MIDVNVWVLNNTQLPSYTFQDSLVSTSFEERLVCCFSVHFEKYFNLVYKSLLTDHCSGQGINILPLPCESYSTLKFYVETVGTDLVDYCRVNNIKILLCLTREVIELHEYEELSNLIESNWVVSGITSDDVRILVNSFKPLTDFKHNKYVTSVDIFKHFTMDFNPKLPTSKNNIPVSIFGGTLYNRPFRCLFLAELHTRGLLSELEYSNVVIDPRNLEYNIYENLHYLSDNDKLKVVSCLDVLTENRTYDKDGLLTNTNIYKTGHELLIIPQLNNSIISVALETRYIQPSITEKTYKLFRAGVIPLWHGPQNVKQYLESCQFKFPSIIDYRFDCLDATEDRLYALCDEIERILTIPIQSLIEAKESVQSNIDVLRKISGSIDERLFTFNSI